MPINISNAKRRDAIVALEGVRPKRSIRYIDQEYRDVRSVRLLKSDTLHDLEEVLKKYEPEDLSELLIREDPEIDIETFGRFLIENSRVFVNDAGMVHSVEEFEIVYNPDGSVRERRPRRKELQNINSETPIRWTGKFIKKPEAARRFVFTNKKQLIHINGLTFDFLYEIANELQEKDSLLLLRGGEKGDRPLVMQRGGKPYNAFLEGRVEGQSYCLILHLSNLELKKPVAAENVQ